MHFSTESNFPMEEKKQPSQLLRQISQSTQDKAKKSRFNFIVRRFPRKISITNQIQGILLLILFFFGGRKLYYHIKRDKTQEITMFSSEEEINKKLNAILPSTETKLAKKKLKKGKNYFIHLYDNPEEHIKNEISSIVTPPPTQNTPYPKSAQSLHRDFYSYSLLSEHNSIPLELVKLNLSSYKCPTGEQLLLTKLHIALSFLQNNKVSYMLINAEGGILPFIQYSHPESNLTAMHGARFLLGPNIVLSQHQFFNLIYPYIQTNMLLFIVYAPCRRKFTPREIGYSLSLKDRKSIASEYYLSAFKVLRRRYKNKDRFLNVELPVNVFRKFFVENGAHLESVCMFIEIDNYDLAKKIGLVKEESSKIKCDHIGVFQFGNYYESMYGKTHDLKEVRFYNLKLLKRDKNQVFNPKNFGKYFGNKNEMVDNDMERLLNKINYDPEAYSQFYNDVMKFLEKEILEINPIIEIQSEIQGYFYLNHLKNKGEKVLLLFIEEGKLSEDKKKELVSRLQNVKKQNKDIKIVLTENKNSLHYYHIIPDEDPITIRYFNHGNHYIFTNEITRKFFTQKDMETEFLVENKLKPIIFAEKYSLSCENDKTKEDLIIPSAEILNKFIEEAKERKITPYLEEENLKVKNENCKYENITHLNSSNYEKELKRGAKSKIVFIYCNYCEECEKQKKEFIKLAKANSSERGKKFFMFNTNNECNSVPVLSKIPSIIHYSPKNQQILTYNTQDSKLTFSQYITHTLQSSP
jgi:hypothetical protein